MDSKCVVVPVEHYIRSKYCETHGYLFWADEDECAVGAAYRKGYAEGWDAGASETWLEVDIKGKNPGGSRRAKTGQRKAGR